MNDKKRRGRPTQYTPEVAEAICERLATGETLRSICRDEDMPHESTVRAWATKDFKADPDDENEEGFYTQYARARDLGLDAMADELLEIADDGTNDWQDRLDGDGNPTGQKVVDHEHVTRSRLRVDSRKWYLSKLAPKRYGERIAQQMLDREGEPTNPPQNVIASLVGSILDDIDGQTADLPSQHNAGSLTAPGKTIPLE